METFIVSKLLYIAYSTWLSLMLWETKAVSTPEKGGQGLLAELVQLPHVFPPAGRRSLSLNEVSACLY